VYDATTAGTPVTKTVTLTTSYVPLLANTPIVSFDPNNYCANNGVLNISFTGGKSPFRIKITNTTTGISNEATGITERTHTLTSLAPGDYIFEVEDACGQWVQNAPGTFSTVATSGSNLSSTTFSSITFSDGNSSNMQFTNNGNCENFIIRTYYSDIKIYLNGGSTTLPVSGTNYSQIKIRVEYPAGSNTFSTWLNIYSSPSFSFTNFDRSQTNGDKFRIQVQHPCTGNITTSPV
jgi:hypothetical protein